MSASTDSTLDLIHAWSSKSVYLMLELYYERLHKFRNSRIMKKILWQEILVEMEKAGFQGLTWKGLDRKMRNLKVHFLHAKKRKGDRSSWEYYGILSCIYDDASGAESTRKIEAKTDTKTTDEISDSSTRNAEELYDDTMHEFKQDTKYLCDVAHTDSVETSVQHIAANPSSPFEDDEEKQIGFVQKHNQVLELMMQKIDESNRIQKERNMILKHILNRLK